MNINHVIICGRLGQNPRAVETQGDMAITSFSVATSRKYKGNEETEWHDVTCFGKTAEIAAQYLTKGQVVAVEGRIKTDIFTDKQGVEQRRKKIVANSIQMGSKSANQQYQQQPQQQQQTAPPQPQPAGATSGIDYPTETIDPNDIPF